MSFPYIRLYYIKLEIENGIRFILKFCLEKCRIAFYVEESIDKSNDKNLNCRKCQKLIAYLPVDTQKKGSVLYLKFL